MPTLQTLINYLQRIELLKGDAENKRRPRSIQRKRSPEIKSAIDSDEQKESPVSTAHTRNALLGKAKKAFASHPLLGSYSLDEDDLCVVSGFYARVNEDFDFDLPACQVMKLIPGSNHSLRTKVDRLVSLVSRQIINPISEMHDYHTDLNGLLENRMVFNSLMLNILMGKDPYTEALDILIAELPGSESPLQTIVRCINAYVNYYPELLTEYVEHSGLYLGNTADCLMEGIITVVKSLPEDNSLIQFLIKYEMEEVDAKVFFWFFYLDGHTERRISPRCIANLLSSSREEFNLIMRRLCGSSPLLLNDLIRTSSRAFFGFPGLEFTENGLAELEQLTDISPGSSIDLAALVKKSKYLSLLTTNQTMENLVLPRDTLQIVSSTIERLRNPERFDLSRWGLLAASLSADSSAINGCCILLHGEPGTGKTFVAGVIANELGRSLVQIEANNIRDCFYGDTEKNARRLFTDMRGIIAKAELAPVFLLNEGDQLIHARTDVNRTSVSAENTLQNIFLEEMETFPGILIVTTNLIENMDAAMSRRFAYKLEFRLPDAVSRALLWRMHLPSTIPGAEKINICWLADRYVFSGGQIRLVVQNACYQAMLRGDKSKLKLEDLVRYADLESFSSFDREEEKKVGF